MTFPIALTLLIAAVVFCCFALEVAAVEIIAVGVMLSLVFLRLLPPDQAFAGFGSSAVIMIAGIVVMSGALIHNGVADQLSHRIHVLAGSSEKRLRALLFGAVAGTSAFFNNTATTAMYIPVAEGISRRGRIPLRQLLMPIAFASMLGGTLTLIGTSTNVAVSGALEHFELTARMKEVFANELVRDRLRPIGMFELTPIGLLIAAAGFLYLVFFSRLVRATSPGPDLASTLREYVFEIVVLPASPTIGRTLAECAFTRTIGLTVLAILRGERRLIGPGQDIALEEGDVLLVQGDVRKLLEVARQDGVDVKTDPRTVWPDFESGKGAMVEATISYNSPFIAKTLKEIDFRARYALNVVGIYRHGSAIFDKVGHTLLAAGDVLLVQGPKERLARLNEEPASLLVADVTLPRFHPQKARLALTIFLAAIVLGGLEIVPVQAAFLVGAFVMVVTRCLTLQEAYQYLNLKLIVLIAGMISLGVAMEKTGTAAYLAGLLTQSLGVYGPLAVMAGLFWLTVLLTQPLNNAAAALLVLPIGIRAAANLGVHSRPLAIAVCLAASCSFMTPFEPSCVLVYSLGKYRFMDFVKGGFPLTIVVFAIVMLFAPIFWPF